MDESYLQFCQSDAQREALKAFLKHGSIGSAAAAIGKDRRGTARMLRRIEAAKHHKPQPPIKVIACETKRKHLVIPDTQCKPGVPDDHFTALGHYIVEKQPDVIVHIGDHWDMPSLSSYDEGKAGFDQRDYLADIEAGNEAMRKLFAPIDEYNKRRKNKYQPECFFTIGNHENRINRATESASSARFRGIITMDDCDLSRWQAVPFLTPVCIDGIYYCHYFVAPRSGRAYGGNAHYKLAKLKFSFIMGHVQDKDTAHEYLNNGQTLRGLQAGTFYQHDEEYHGFQGGHYWRGVHMLHEVRQGNYDHMEVSMDFLRRRYL